MPHSIARAQFLGKFECLGDACEDTCCKGWGMQLTQETVARYKQDAPELMEAVATGEAEYIMRRDPETDYCVKFDKGWCGIHAKYGTDFLGDACHFFPRVTRRLGDAVTMTASLSCPEVARLTLMGETPFAFEDAVVQRLPYSLKDYKLEALSTEQALTTHRAFLDAASDMAATPERILLRIHSAACSLEQVDAASWAEAATFYLKNADARLPSPETNPADPFNLLNALQGLIGAARKSNRPRLEETVRAMEQALAVTLDWERLSIQISEHSLPAYLAMEKNWHAQWRGHFDAILRRWIQAQLSVALYPFAGFGNTLGERAAIIGVRFATLKLALMSACQQKGEMISPEDTIRAVQSLARFLDHLADPTLSLNIYTETKWLQSSRLRALLAQGAEI